MTSTKKRILFPVILLAAIVTIGMFIFKNNRDANDDPANPDLSLEPGETTATELPVPVQADTAQIADLVIRISATGVTRSLRQVTISPRTAGQIVDLPIREGHFVSRDALLLKLDDREFRLALAEAENQLLGAQVEYDFLGLARTEKTKSQETGLKLKKVESGSSETKLSGGTDSSSAVAQWSRREDVMAYKSGLARARVAVEKARLNLAFTEIRAPFAGHVADLTVTLGQQVAPGSECLKLVDLSALEVQVAVLESEIGQVQTGRQARVTFPAYPDQSFAGDVIQVNPAVDPKTKTARVTVRLVQPKQHILPGMFAYVKLDARIYPNRLLVPKEAILERDQRKLVFIIRDGLAKWCYVETGRENEESVEVLSSAFDLKPGELVITSGHYTLVHDAKVRF